MKKQTRDKVTSTVIGCIFFSSQLGLVSHADGSTYTPWSTSPLLHVQALLPTDQQSLPSHWQPLPPTLKTSTSITTSATADKPEWSSDEKSKSDKHFEEKSFASPLQCPDKASVIGRKGWQWYLCNLAVADKPFFTPNEIDYPLSYMTPSSVNFTSEMPARLIVSLHPDDGGRGAFVTGPSSFLFRQDAVEIHPVEQKWNKNSGGWWVYSGGQIGKAANYNGRQITAGIDYVLERYGDKIDLDKGIHLKGKSLGGAGAMHQSMVLPKYQTKIAIVDATIALMMIPKNHKKQLLKAWDNPMFFDEVDIRLQWQKVEDIHFSWRGGANDSFKGFDPEFIEICELRKISCSLVWLQSRHGLSESGYTIPMTLFTDAKQDATLDKILPVITNNTSNFHGKLRGYHNRGISWNHAEISDTPTMITIPLRYVAQKNMGEELPDQPDATTFSVTPRHVRNFQMKPGDLVSWKFGTQSGTAIVDSDNLLTIDKLVLSNGREYTNLYVRLTTNDTQR